MTPTYVAAEAETSELPKIVDGTPPVRPASPVKRSRIGDLPMRVIYRVLAGVAAVVVAAVAALVGFTSSDSADRPGEEAPGRVAAPSAAAPSPGPASPPPSSAATPSPLAATASPRPTPDGSAVTAALADPRVPERPRDRKLARFPGKALPSSKRRVEDERSGVSLVRLGKPWKTYGASPFSTKQVLPPVKGAGHRAMLVSCPVPIEAQAAVKDTAILAARWTLNHHPKGSRIRWSASQPIKDGWLLAYRVTYKVKGKSRSSMAAVALTETDRAKPALVFVTIPDAQRKRWRDITTAVSSIRHL
ncbi:hypothetical protein [Planomonospora sp. ID82291]|uniref:hypothetical protein n=1 Tax=Planomonospora sp. ID82291 TaxID=2738136 RepID=UPI0018C3C5EC|nr:hypothetical protein [Planomonospora sp. ID82291]MBG0812773.1 hypothetical protein [Planomonospora sp. ID82291]